MNTCQISLTKNIYTILGHTFKTLGNKLINTTNKEENQIIVNNIEKDNTLFMILWSNQALDVLI